jgi:subtilisin family serine protease
MSGRFFGHGAAVAASSLWRTRINLFAMAAALVLISNAFAQERAIFQPPADWNPSEHVLYAFTPNDPYYFTGSPAGFKGQWHLSVQSSGAVYDANVVPAWNRDITGQGVVIGIVDDGLQAAHPDLSPNFDAADSENFSDGIGGSVDPSPVNSNTAANNPDGDNHGTSVAGVAAARGGNGIGVTGAAPYASLAGLRINFPAQTTQMFVDATLYHSSGGNTNIKVKNHSYGISAPYIPSVAEANAVVTSTNAGTIHVFAAGNERCVEGGSGSGACSSSLDGDANKKHLQSLQETITVAALGSNGKFASYSNYGANVWVTAPSNSSGFFGITTTDRTGGAATTGGYNNSASGDIDTFPDLNYNSIFGGTSSATPLVSGIMALGKQVQPNLNNRMAKHLLARTSRKIDAADADARGGWITNAAGFNFDENYGFGLIDADAFTAQAALTAAVTPLVTQTIGITNVNQSIPDADLTGISRSFVLGPGLPLEEMEVHLNYTEQYRGDVEAFLTSPSGTVSRLMYRNFLDGNGSATTLDWTFLSNAFWGESPLGTWTLNLKDVYAVGTGTWNNYSILAKMGTLVAIPEPASLILTASGITGIVIGFSRRRRFTCG